jgi:ferrous iron transport protein A
MTLDQCQPNQSCRIIALEGDLDTKMALVHLGFHKNSQVKMLMARPESFIIHIDGSRFAIDRALCRHIRVDNRL